MAKKVGYKFFKYMCTQDTVWKIEDFSITQILCEIKFGDSRSAKSVIFTHLVALYSSFYEFLQFLKAEIYQKTKF